MPTSPTPHAEELAALLERTSGLHEKIVAAVPQLRRGIVWCRTCGRSQKVNASVALAHDWPKCCNFTMTIDAPEERTALQGREG